MAGLVSKLFLLIIQYVLLDCTKHALRWVYKAYGIQMCRALCKDSPDTFYYLQEYLSCHRVSTKYSKCAMEGSAQLNLTGGRRTNATAGCSVQMGLDVCSIEDDSSSETQSELQCSVSVSDTRSCKIPSELTTDATRAKGVKIAQYKCGRKLQAACRKGRLCVVKELLSKRMENINCLGRTGRTPVMMAARSGRVNVFDYLLGQGCDLSAVDKKDSVLHYACMSGNVDIVRKLVDSEKCDKDGKGSLGMRPVMYAIAFHHMEAFRLLERKGCNLTAVDTFNYNILHIASGKGNVDIVQYILSKNILSIDSRGQVGRTPVMVAAEKGHKSVFELLVKNGCNLTAVDDFENNILHIACCKGHVDIAEYILSQNMVSIDCKGRFGRTPVMMTAATGHASLVELLVRRGCNLRVVDGEKNSILHVACKYGREGVVKYLMTLRAGEGMVKVENKDGCTPVQVADIWRREAVVRLLKGRK